MEIVDPHRIRFVLHTPWPDFLTFYATPATAAAARCLPGDAARLRAACDQIVAAFRDQRPPG